jgi:hypothetical protein
MKKRMLCIFCGEAIPELRLKYLPDTMACVQCSQTRPYSSQEVLGIGNPNDYTINSEDFENEYGNNGPFHTAED